MHYAIFLAVAVIAAVLVAVWCALRHGSSFDLGCLDDYEHPVSIPLRVREMETPAAQFARRVESEANDEQRSPYPDEVDLFLIHSETIGA